METYNLLLGLDSGFIKKCTLGEIKDIKKPFEDIIRSLNGKVINFHLMIGGEYNCTTIVQLEDKIILAKTVLLLKEINYLNYYRVYSLFSETELEKFMNIIRN